MEHLGTSPIKGATKIVDLVARPQVNFENLSAVIPSLKEAIEASPNRKEEIAEAAEIKLKYKGYIDRERVFAEKMRRLEDIKIKGHFKYSELHDLSTEPTEVRTDSTGDARTSKSYSRSEPKRH